MSKTLTNALANFLLTTPAFRSASLIKITLLNTQTIHVTDSDVDILYDGNMYYSTLYGKWRRGEIVSEADYTPKANTLELTANIKQSVPFPGTSTSMTACVNNGVFDGAGVKIYQCYWGIEYPPQTPVEGIAAYGIITMFIGNIASCKDTGDSQIKFDVVDMLYLLNQNTPPNLIQAQCRHTLFDFGCALTKAAFANYGCSANTGSTSTTLVVSLPSWQASHSYSVNVLIYAGGAVYRVTVAGVSGGSAPSWASAPINGDIVTDGGVTWLNVGDQPTTTTAYYTFGTLVFTSGQNTGITYFIKFQQIVSGVMYLLLGSALYFPLAIGDTFTLYPGCDKILQTCTNKFSNQIHYGGFPFVPDPTTAA